MQHCHTTISKEKLLPSLSLLIFYLAPTVSILTQSLLNHYLVIEMALKRSSKSAASSLKERKVKYQFHSCFWLFVVYNRFKIQGC